MQRETLKNLFVLFCALGLILVACTAFCADYYVDVNKGCDDNTGVSPGDAWKSITWALESTVGTENDWAIIHIAPGRYTPPYEHFRLRPSSYTSLVGTNPEEVVIDAEGTASVLSLTNYVRISGLTITGGNDITFGHGGGISLAGGCRVENCIVQGNQSSRFGGGLFAAFYPSLAYAELIDCVICDNYASVNGGGMYITSQAGNGKVWATRCLFSSNVSPAGAGICAISAGLELVDCVVADNTAEAEDGHLGVGGGIAVKYTLSASSFDFKNCLFLSNKSLKGLGGAAYIETDYEGLAVKFSGCTFVENTVGEYGPGLHVRISGRYSLPAVEVTDCIFRDGGDEIWEVRRGLVRLNNSCIEGGWDGEGQNNFDADPLFVTGPYGDYYLSQTAATQGEDSPCVDAGSMTAAEAGMDAMTTRTDGLPDWGVVDIGYHYPATLVIVPEVWVSTPSDTYSHGEALEVVFEAVNPNPFSYPVDLFVGVITPGGVLWTIDSNWVWSTSLNPCLPSLELPASFAFGPTTLLAIDLPSTAPPITDPGTYYVAAAFAHVGTSTFIAEPSLSAFELIED
ncbi:hypothetical protein J7M28_12090 [bacterium]|nr:hypothetical protein [bacterium]